MKKILFLMTVVVASLFCSSCEDALDTTNYTKANTANYPATAADAAQILAGIYNNLNIVSANPQESFFYTAELASDDRFGGGGDNDKLMQALDLICANGSDLDMLKQFWADRYAGIFRANNAIETLPNCSGYDSDDQKNQMLGEAYFLRAFYYYEIASFWGKVPLITVTATGKDNVAQSEPEAIWGQILYDLKTAIEIMPAKKFGSGWVKDGHVDKWCAEALAGRAYLFYSGFYKDDKVTLTDGTELAKSDVSAWIDDCVTNSGYSLVLDFRNLWAYTNRLTKEDYTYTKGKGLDWVEDDSEINPESMFEIKFNELASWSTTIGYGNGYALHFGVRGGQDYGKTFPFGQGWGAGPVAPNLWNDWLNYETETNDGKEDVRRKASICYIPDELPNYTKGGSSDFVQETDYYEKKMSPISCVKDVDAGTYWSTFESSMYPDSWSNAIDNMQLDNIHDMVLIRFSEVLLMQSELEENVSGINKVRERAGLKDLASYSLEALQKERRFELCFEGIRWNDIRRWHIADKALEKQTGQACYHAGQSDRNTAHNGGYAARYDATGGGFFPIPSSQIDLSDGVLVQNNGWSGSGYQYNGW